MHLLAIPSTSLDETDAAVDLGQTPGDIMALSFSDSDLSALAAAWRASPERLPSLRLASLKALRHPMSVDLYANAARGARLIIVRCLGGLDYWRYGFERLAEIARRQGTLLVALPGDGQPDPRLAEISTAPDEALASFDRYFREGGPENLEQALRLAANLLGAGFDVLPPKPMPPVLGLLPAAGTVPADDLAAGTDPRPAALVVGYRSSVIAADDKPLRALMQALADEGLAPLGIAVTSLKDPDAIPIVERLIGARKPAIIVNATAFSALRDNNTSVLDLAGVPVLQVALSGARFEAWEPSVRGLGPSDLAMNVVLPEVEGRIFTRAVSFKADAVFDPLFEHAEARHEPAPDRVSYVAKLAAAWVRLGRTPRDSRTLALVLSDYPARGGRNGYAVGLDSFESVREILSLLRQEGYDARSEDWTASALVSLPKLSRQEGPLTPTLSHKGRGSRGVPAENSSPSPLAGDGTGVRGKLGGTDAIEVPLEDYRVFLASLPYALQKTLAETWGEPEEDPSFSEGCFRFRRLKAGKISVLFQPDRGASGARRQGYHDVTCPPRHSYVALYAWLRERERIDAMIHLGTHGTLEWLPGKALALSAACFPEAVLGPIPVIYPFIVNNPGEAVHAKRRLSAVTVGHLTPPLSKAGLHGDMAELEGLMEEYAEADGVDKRRATLLESEILDRAWQSGLARDCGIDPGDMPREALAKLDAQLCDIKELAIRDRLHVFGRAPDAESRAALTDAIGKAAGLNASETGRIGDLIEQCAASERNALLAALDGRRVPPGPSGAPTRGRIDVLPTGRNLTTIDPRSIPTRTATAIGARAADEVIRRHLQDHGEYPKSVVLDLWASATLRTGGDDLAQALAYLGVKPVWDVAANRVTGVEVIPLVRLDRPRIDVTLRISGLFRDIFESQMLLFASAVRLVAGLSEEAEWNPLAGARRRNEGVERIFGGAPGVYGAGAASLTLDRAWTARDEIGAAYLAASSQAYDGGGDGMPAPREFRARVAQADALIHTQDDRERDILDGDGVADYAGGFAAAAASLGGAPALYHLDTSKPEAPTARSFEEEIARIVRGRLTNPRWKMGMLKHGHSGVAEIAQAIDALFAFAAAADAVPDHLFDATHDALFADETFAKAMQDANPAAAEAMARRMLEALSRGLWRPRRNAVQQELSRLACEPPREHPSSPALSTLTSGAEPYA
jgi:cobaltochelatase CobN